MASRRFWKGFAAGAAAGAGAGFGSWFLSRAIFHGQSRIVRLEKSLQVGRPIDEVFLAWSDFERLPRLVRLIEEVQVHGKRSRWRMRLNGRSFEWEAELTQSIPNQALGWKSVSGPKHTGRINFSPLGYDTEVHVVMNYAPPGGELAGDLTGQTAGLEHYLGRRSAISRPHWKARARKMPRRAADLDDVRRRASPRKRQCALPGHTAANQTFPGPLQLQASA